MTRMWPAVGKKGASKVRRAIGKPDRWVVEFKEKCARQVLESLGLSPSTGISQNHPVLVVTHYQGRPLRTKAQAEHVKRIVNAEIARLKRRSEKRAREEAKIRKERAIRMAARILRS
ncbi:hypothetical protein A2112_01215 [Candidatus Woesebacteria bacterium GWA1_42_12]|uniref:Uncharacterized protein n=1 Tax=Candidatus Woesebacteria bacterium GWA1_42_12 TaxID=1802472 RepID=A0A1F7WMH4_9BACT|nr:MAG: hypothetical protein A2112_01215 [Candidatus Woesebacteria bacterium GWA1_42_12]